MNAKEARAVKITIVKKAPKPVQKANQNKAEETTPKAEKQPQANFQPKNKPIGLIKKVLFVASESQPFCGTGGLADIACGLPRFIKEEEPDVDMRVVLPKYQFIKPEYKDKFEYIGNTYNACLAT